MNRDCIGMTCYQAFPGRDEICEGCPVARAIESKRIERGVMFQPVSRTATDEQYWENIGVPQLDANGGVVACIEISRNITDRMQATKELEAVNSELEAFAYSVSHDLRAPLRHIDGFVDLLRKRTAENLDPQSQHYMDTISDSAKRMGELIDDLLSFSRAGRREMRKIPCDLGVLVQEAVRELEPEAADRDIHWQVEDFPVITGDPAMLRLVLVNLISNALKFTRPRQQAEIEIGCLDSDETEVVVFVRDNGVGFNPDYAGKLFGVFQRLHGTGEFEGTGIGLANVRRIIGRHGGRTWAEGAVNQGATFFFSLPRTPQGS